MLADAGGHTTPKAAELAWEGPRAMQHHGGVGAHTNNLFLATMACVAEATLPACK